MGQPFCIYNFLSLSLSQLFFSVFLTNTAQSVVYGSNENECLYMYRKRYRMVTEMITFNLCIFSKVRCFRAPISKKGSFKPFHANVWLGCCVSIQTGSCVLCACDRKAFLRHHFYPFSLNSMLVPHSQLNTVRSFLLGIWHRHKKENANYQILCTFDPNF